MLRLLKLAWPREHAVALRAQRKRWDGRRGGVAGMQHDCKCHTVADEAMLGSEQDGDDGADADMQSEGSIDLFD